MSLETTSPLPPPKMEGLESPDKPQRSIRVVSLAPNGDLEFHTEAFAEMVRLTNSKFGMSPVAIVCVTGPRSCGKSFYANLLMHRLRSPADIRWLSRLSTDFGDGNQEIFRGFRMKHDKSMESSRVSNPGIDIWPEIFHTTDVYGNGLNVVVLDISSSDVPMATTGSYNEPILELFVNLVCSKIVEIHWSPTQELRNLKWRKHLLNSPGITEGEVCNNHTYLHRSFASPQTFAKASESQMPQLKDLKYFVNAHVTDTFRPVLNSKEKLQVDPLLLAQLSIFVRHTVETKGQLEGKQYLWVGKTVRQFELDSLFQRCVKLVNEFRHTSEGHAVLIGKGVSSTPKAVNPETLADWKLGLFNNNSPLKSEEAKPSLSTGNSSFGSDTCDKAYCQVVKNMQRQQSKHLQTQRVELENYRVENATSKIRIQELEMLNRAHEETFERRMAKIEGQLQRMEILMEKLEEYRHEFGRNGRGELDENNNEQSYWENEQIRLIIKKQLAGADYLQSVNEEGDMVVKEGEILAEMEGGERVSSSEIVIGMGTALLSQIDKGDGRFKSDLGRHLVRQQILESLNQFRENLSHSEYDIERKVKVLSELQERYFTSSPLPTSDE